MLSNARVKLAKLGLSVTVFFWLLISFLAASASIVCVDYAKHLFKFKAPDFIALVQQTGWILLIPPLVGAWKKYNIQPTMPTREEWMVYLIFGIVNAFGTYLKSLALTLLPGSTYTILFESDLIWNVLLSVTFLRRCYHPLQFLSPAIIFGSTIVVSYSTNVQTADKYTGLGKFGGVGLALLSTFLTGSVAVLSDWLLKRMMERELKHRSEQESLVGIISETDADYTEQLLERNMSKIWYQNLEEVRNLEFSFWTSLSSFIFLIFWTLADPSNEYQQWPTFFATMRNSPGHVRSWNIFVFSILIVLLAFARTLVTVSMNHILMVLSAFFFAVWKPFRRIGTIFLSIALFDDKFGVYTAISICMDTLALFLFTYGGYLYRKKMERERLKNTVDLE